VTDRSHFPPIVVVKPPGGMELDDQRLARLGGAFSTLKRIPVATSMMSDLEGWIRTYRSLILSAHGPDAATARDMWVNRIRPNLEACVRGNFGCLDGRYPLIADTLDKLTSQRS
jgi:hypothetical protein